MKNSNKKTGRKSVFRQNKKVSKKCVLNLIIEAQKYFENNKLEQANCLYQQVLQVEPENISALNGLGLIAMQAGMLTIAVELLNVACDIAPQHLTVNKNLALAYTRLSRYEEAIMQYICILDIDENNGDAHGELARLNLQAGHLELALHHYRNAFELNPDDARNLHGLVQLDVKTITASDIEKVERILMKKDLQLDKRSSFYFALGNIYDASGRYDEAFANYSVANICKGSTFDSNKHEGFISNLIDTFSVDLFEKYADIELNESSQPIFIVGMPRSGTTMVEQILASHSDVFATGGINLIADIAKKLDINTELNIDHSLLPGTDSASIITDSAQYYLNEINNLALAGNNKKPLRISNNLPANFIYLGLIALLFPNAHIIHCKRNPLDICLSCYFQNFAGEQNNTNDLNNMGLYYQQYARLMAHWENVLPVDIHTVNYEDMVKKPQATSRELIEFTGLDWQQACNDFYKTKSNVNTASLAQLRKKIYQSSLNRWQHYEKHLDGLKHALGIFEYADETANIAMINMQSLKNDGSLYNYLC